MSRAAELARRAAVRAWRAGRALLLRIAAPRRRHRRRRCCRARRGETGAMDFWDQMVDCVCRPPRDVYTMDMLLGSPAGHPFAIGPVKVKRTDFELVRGWRNALRAAGKSRWKGGAPGRAVPAARPPRLERPPATRPPTGRPRRSAASLLRPPSADQPARREAAVQPLRPHRDRAGPPARAGRQAARCGVLPLQQREPEGRGGGRGAPAAHGHWRGGI